MCTKTIAVENSVYERLAREKRSSESFTKTIDRLIHAASSGTCAAAVADAASVWQATGNDADADRMEQLLHLGPTPCDPQRLPVRARPKGDPVPWPTPRRAGPP